MLVRTPSSLFSLFSVIPLIFTGYTYHTRISCILSCILKQIIQIFLWGVQASLHGTGGQKIRHFPGADPGWAAAVFSHNQYCGQFCTRYCHKSNPQGQAVSPVRGISFFGVSGAWLLMMAKPSELSPVTKYSDHCVLLSLFCERRSSSWLRQKRPMQGLTPRINLFQTSQHHWRCSQVCYIIFPAYSL